MLQSLFSLLFLLKFSRSQNCVTIQDEHAIEDGYAPRFGQNCVFPFIFRGKKYDKCTTDADPDDRFWCATKLNSEGEYFDGKFFFISQRALEITLFLKKNYMNITSASIGMDF